jgi:hypothetical protein
VSVSAQKEYSDGGMEKKDGAKGLKEGANGNKGEKKVREKDKN